MSSNINVAPQYDYLLGGDPVKGTGNFGGDGEDHARLHVEWESGTVPRFVYPTENDAVKLWGSWVWDCDHWGQAFEFDPTDPAGRAAPARPAGDEAETDAFISAQGTKAHLQERCALQNPPPPPQLRPAVYGPDFTLCVESGSNRQTVNDRDYSFFVPAPPKPSPDSALAYRVVNMIGETEKAP